MTYSLRALALCFATSALLWAPACSSSSDPAPQTQAIDILTSNYFTPQPLF